MERMLEKGGPKAFEGGFFESFQWTGMLSRQGKGGILVVKSQVVLAFLIPGRPTHGRQKP